MEWRKIRKKVLTIVLVIAFGLLMAEMYGSYNIPEGIRMSNALRPIKKEMAEFSFGTTVRGKATFHNVDVEIKVLREEDFEKVIARCQELFTTEICQNINKAGGSHTIGEIQVIFSTITGEKGPVEYTLMEYNHSCYIPDEKDKEYRKENYLVWHEGEDICPIKPEGTE